MIYCRNCLSIPLEDKLGKSLRLGFLVTNNEAEYEVLLARMMMVSKLGCKVVLVFLDLRLVVGQINGEFEARKQRMQ